MACGSGREAAGLRPTDYTTTEKPPISASVSWTLPPAIHHTERRHRKYAKIEVPYNDKQRALGNSFGRQRGYEVALDNPPLLAVCILIQLSVALSQTVGLTPTEKCHRSTLISAGALTSSMELKPAEKLLDWSIKPNAKQTEIRSTGSEIKLGWCH